MARAGFTVKTNGQTLKVTAYRTGNSSFVPALYTTGALSSAHTLPLTISSDTDFYLADNNAGHYTISVKQMDGTEICGRQEYLGGGGLVTIEPVPSALQLAADVKPRNAFLRTGAIAETVSRNGTVLANVSMLLSGRMQLVAIELPAGAVVSSITYLSATTAAGTPTAQWFALYNADLTLIGQTADDTSTAWAADSEKTLAITSPVTTTRSGLHYLGICVVGGTMPTLMSCAGGAVPSALAPIMAGQSTTGLTTTAPATAAAITAVGAQPYAWVG